MYLHWNKAKFPLSKQIQVYIIEDDGETTAGFFKEKYTQCLVKFLFHIRIDALHKIFTLQKLLPSKVLQGAEWKQYTKIVSASLIFVH